MPDPPLSSDTPDESALLFAAVKKGNLGAFEKLVRLHQAGVRAFLAARLARRDEAEDLAQDVFLTAYRKRDEFDPALPLGPWLRGIARNLLLNHLRKFRPQPIGGLDALQGLLDKRLAEQLTGEREPATLAALRECLSELDGPALGLVVSHYLEGETLREIQSRTGRGYSALTMQLHRTRAVLARCIEGKQAFAPQS